jgi:hypothetical protein
VKAKILHCMQLNQQVIVSDGAQCWLVLVSEAFRDAASLSQNCPSCIVGEPVCLFAMCLFGVCTAEF